MLGLIAFFAIGYTPKSHEIVAKPAGHMDALIPHNPPGWNSEEVPLGQTEEVARAAEKILATTEHFSRRYISDDKTRSFTVYISYWARGLADPRLAASHTPDRCWVSNGWKNYLDKAKYEYPVKIDGKDFIPAYYRELSVDTIGGSNYRYVIFWHTVDGERYDYGTGNTMFNAGAYNYIRNIFVSNFGTPPEQYFIRVDSDIPIEKLMPDKGFKEVLSGLGKLVLVPYADESLNNSKE